MRSLPALALLLGAFGATATTAAAAVPDGRNAAALSLLETAKQDLSVGRAEQASALIERALRIDPDNPTLWHYLGLARLELGDSAQAQAMAAKSRSLTAHEPPARSVRQVADDLWSSARSIGQPRTRRPLPEANVAAARRYRGSLPEGCRLLPGQPRAGQRTWIVKCDVVSRKGNASAASPRRIAFRAR